MVDIPLPEVPFPNSYWVIPGKLLAGEYPFSKNENQSISKLTRLLQSGIRAIADLTQPGDAHPYNKELARLADEFVIKVAYHRFAIQDMAVPEIKIMKSILNWIDERLMVNSPSYVHCVGGIGRTGTVVGCHLVRHGMSGEDALKQINALRQRTPDWWCFSPETWQQKDFILNWKIGA